MKEGGADLAAEALASEMLSQILDIDIKDATSVVAFAVARKEKSVSRVRFEHLGPWGGDRVWSRKEYDPRFHLRTFYRLDAINGKTNSD